MKNITNIEKTTTAKITAKITTTALLFFLALFTRQQQQINGLFTRNH